MGGLARICKLYGSMVVQGKDGKKITWVWDYANDKPVHDTEMPFGSERHMASERARYSPNQPQPLERADASEKNG